MNELINPVEKIDKGKDFILRPNGIFHNGINIETKGEVKSIAKGKVIAYRFSKDYIPLENIDNSNISRAHFHWLGNDFFQDTNLIEGENQNNNYKTYFERIENQKKDKKKDKKDDQNDVVYKLKEGLSDFDKIEAYYYLRRLVSNSFVLMEYELPQINQETIKFYMLYNHLAPFCRMRCEHKLKLAWFSKQKLSLNNAEYTYVTTEDETPLPSELKLKNVSKVKDGIYKISWNDYPGLPAGTGTIKESLIRVDLKETRRAYRKGIDSEAKEAVCLAESDKKTKKGIIIYTNEKVGDRNVKAIVSEDSKFDCDINDLIKAFDTPFNDDKKDISFCPLKVKCDGTEGYIYLNEKQDYKTKEEWEKDIKKFDEVITGNEPIKFKSFELNLNFRETKNGKQIKIEEDKICFPKDLEIDEGEVIGYSGFNFMKEDTVGNGKTVVSDNDIRDSIIHIETFFENDEKLKFDYFKDGKLKKADLLKPFFLKVNSEAQLVNKKPECKLTAAAESYDGCIAKVENGFGFYDNEEFYKLTVYANTKLVDSNSFIENGKITAWTEKGNWYKATSNKSTPTYDKNANLLKEDGLSLLTGYIYYFDDGRDTDETSAWGKVGLASKKLRHVDCTYEILSQSKVYYIKSVNYSEMKNNNKITENRWFTEIDQKDIVWIKGRLDSSNLYSKIEKSEGETETVAAEKKLEPTSEEIIEYATEERKEESAVWVNAKDNEGKSYWVKKSDIKTEKGGTPVELVSYYDWNKLFDKIELKDNKQYIVCEPEKLEKKDKFSAKFNRFDRQRKIQRLADCGIGEDFANRLLDGKEGNFFFTHVNEWSNESKQVTDIQLLTDDPDKIKDSFENYEFFKEVKKNYKDLNQDIFCYIHPNYFLENLRRLVTIPEFNPYEAKAYKYKLTVAGTCTYYNKTTKKYDENPKDLATNSSNYIKIASPGGTEPLNNPVKMDNPGFAPFIETNGVREYAALTGVFNEDYLDVQTNDTNPPETYRNRPVDARKRYHHFGVDFSAEEGTNIASFIHGTVIVKGWVQTDGLTLIIQRNSPKSTGHNYLYLICHLSEFGDKIEEGSIIVPGQIVGKTGRSGGKVGTYSYKVFKKHLHVSVLKYDKPVKSADELLGIVDNGKKQKEITKGESLYKAYKDWSNKNIATKANEWYPLYVDPFNYTVPWITTKP